MSEDVRDLPASMRAASSSPPLGLEFATLGLLVVVSWLVARLRRLKRARGRTAYERALAQLAAAVPDASAERPDEFAERVLRTVREYIEARCELPATTRTTEEFLSELLGQPELGPQRRELRSLLQSRAYVRFAGRVLQRDAMYTLRAAAVQFVAAAERSPHRVRRSTGAA